MKKEKLFFRKANESETQLIHDFIETQFGLTALKFIKSKDLWIKEGKIKEVFIVNKELNTVLDTLIKQSFYDTIYFAGTPIGSLKGDEFQLEMEGGYLLKQYTKKRIKIKTQQFLYGKHIFAANIVSISEPFERGDWVIVQGKNNLHFGVGKALFSSVSISRCDPNCVIIEGHRKRPLDRGWYLRFGH
ncbi:MAG: PUA domain-containing protein [Candidatus Heimdallarchaeaceae archaeon]